MIKYYDLKTKTFDCQKAYKAYIQKIGTDRPFEMSNEQIVIFSILSFVARRFTIITLDNLNKQKELYLKERYNYTKEEIEKVDLLNF